MLQKFFSKYGLGTHLALLAAVPLALTPFLDATRLASVVFWLSAFGLVWLLTEPSIRAGEHLSLARRRVRMAIIRDPFFWFLFVVLIYALIRLYNSGIELKYDPEQTAWLVGEPRLGGGPSSVDGAGILPFAVATAIFVVAMGIRHGIGLMARAEFGVAGALFSGIGGLAAAGCACGALEPFVGWLRAGFSDAPFWASSFGVWLILGIVCGAQAEARKWGVARLPYVIGLVGNGAALVFFAPPLVALAWFVLGIFVLIFSLVYLSRASTKGAVARNFFLALFGLALPIFLLMTFVPEAGISIKIAGLDTAQAFPEVYQQATEALSRISRQIWMTHPWFGVGAGAYGLHVPFLAEKADWALIPAQPKFALNGYWTLLAERGIVGCALPVVALGILLATYVLRLTGAFFYLRRRDDADIFPFAVPPVAWCAPFVLLLLAVEALASPIFQTDTLFLTVLSVLSLSAAAFPKAKVVATPDGDVTHSSEN
ncbi:MAG: hypothetical protein ACI4RA_09340 [Kiritimatiellia bacterium]